LTPFKSILSELVPVRLPSKAVTVKLSLVAALSALIVLGLGAYE
jgi:hypothetical protein